MATYRVHAVVSRTLGTTTVEASSPYEARMIAETLEHGDFDQADDTELLIDDVYLEKN